tara:strand:+ start:250 stop:423 length:174 start_codon:yes stop_codon:yes gene_type:complete
VRGLRVLELAEALGTETSDVLSICVILNLNATSRLSMLTFEDCKKVTDYFEKNKFQQ